MMPMNPDDMVVEDEQMLQAVDEGVVAADEAAADEEKLRVAEAEKNSVKAMWKEYEQARAFDKVARAQYAIDRRYAAGTAHMDYAVNANLIGAFIDILVSFLYARNPDVSAKKSPRIDNEGTVDEDGLAKTMEIVISKLWRSPSAQLKTNLRAQVRSALTTGPGWVKAIIVCKGENIPQMRTELNDIRRNIADLEALRATMSVTDAEGNVIWPDGVEPKSPEQVDADTTKFRTLEASIAQRLEVAVRKGLVVDFVAPEDVQVSLDVRALSDYRNAGWIANAIYRPISDLSSMFKAVTEEDSKNVKQYFQRATQDLQPLTDIQKLTGLAGVEANPDAAEQYTADNMRSGDNTDDRGIPHAKIVELWNRRTGHVHTMIDGLDKWAKQPYQPDYPSTRFYPYYLLEFYPVDGARHPQSLSWRLMKLQDEYASMRSSQRLTRQRSIPGTIFNKAGVTPEDARKIEQSVHQEMIGIAPVNPEQPFNQLFAEKPVGSADIRLFDSSDILRDMEKISGVQEALQTSASPEKTATQAEIEQTGFASRTTADRDTLETMLGDLAHTTGELALSALEPTDAQRFAGAQAYWPSGMSIDDMLSMVEITIEAGTTGKPKTAGDQSAWGTVLPLIRELMVQIHQANLVGDMPLAYALTELLKETMVRMGDETDVTRFIPQPPELPPALPGVPGAPGDGAVPGGMATDPADPNAAAPPPGEDTGAPVAPELMTPQLPTPELAPQPF